MRRLAIAAIAGTLAFGSPVMSSSLWVPSPLTIVLQVGKWLMVDRVEVYHVRIRAQGRDEQDARDQAFRLAVEQAVGSLLLSHREIRDGEVTRNELLNYSSGHVHDFKILDRQYANGGVSIDVDVWVRKSSIADRLLSESRAEGQVEGGRISAQIQSFQREKTGADGVLRSVLRDFPDRAFDLEVGRTQVISENRSTYLQIPVQVAWSGKFVASMSEALRTVNPRPECSGWLAACESRTVVKVNGDSTHFDDDKTYQLFSHHMLESRPHVKIDFLDSVGKSLHSECYDVPAIHGLSYAPRYFSEFGGGIIKINGGQRQTFAFLVDTRVLPVSQVDRASASIVPASQCQR